MLPSGGPNRLSEDVRNQLEDDELLRKAAKQAFNNDEGNVNVCSLNRLELIQLPPIPFCGLGFLIGNFY